MKLADLIQNLNLQIQPGEQWGVLGPEAEAFATGLQLPTSLDSITAELDGLLLAGLLSATTDPFGWLGQTVNTLEIGTRLVIIDWQYEAPNGLGPELERRVRGGKLCRWLREVGFGAVERQGGHPFYYIVQAVKGDAPATAHAGQFVVVARLDELPKNVMKPVELFGHQIIVANTGREIVAFARACPHAHYPLDQGVLRGRNLVCRSHVYMWNVLSGEPIEPVDEDFLPFYPVQIDRVRGEVAVALPASSHQKI